MVEAGKGEPEGGGGGGESRPPPEGGFRAFTDTALEKLYQSYCVEQKKSGLQCFMSAVILLDLYAVVAGRCYLAWGIGFLVAALGVLLLVLSSKRGGKLPAVAGWVLGVGHVALHVAAGGRARAALAWPVLLVYLGFVALPLRLRHCLLLGAATSLLHGVTLHIFETDREDLLLQHVSNAILLTAAGLLGLLGFLLDDRQQRQAFLETRQSLEVKLVIEEQSAEQERLLLSVLPEHVAVKMRQDLGATDTQFKKIYMSRHENVSILYADIVGFTAISSTYSAQDLVAILNELFARFDRLAEKYHQLRIKILGDCYYCISGAPVERPDHAVLCIHMGLSMVKSIKYLQQTTNSPVDMRVGIHTGAVLAGVLGQRQWQFDVYSRDVELANKMESSGNAGRVHISEKTLSYLNGEFEVEPAFGEKREEALRLAGIKTYFICKVLKPYQPSIEPKKNGPPDANGIDGAILADAPSDGKDEGDSVKSPMEEDKGVLEGKSREDSDEFKNRLRKELVSRDGHSELAKHAGFWLGFRSASLERLYRRCGGASPGFPLAAAAALPPVLTLAALALPPAPSPPAGLLAIAAGLLMFSVSAPFLVQSLTSCGRMAALGRKLGGSLAVRLLASTVVVLLFSLNNAAQMELCARSLAYHNTTEVYALEPTCSGGAWCAARGLACGALGAAAGALAPLPLLARASLAALAAAPPAALTATRLAAALDCRDLLTSSGPDSLFIPTKYALCCLMLAIIIALVVLSRYMEQTSRVLFLWKTQIEEQRERAADMRRRNEALVYNVLPPHVAAHFMGHRRRQHHELYSQSYAEVGVLFASMPNFSEFYSEETVNNQGLECLRFLNEVISDFDALLELPKFQDIIKIKTIGSSYMAAAGLNPTRQSKADDPVQVRWYHLSLLVEFALELKKALQSINEQSFNHFVLKMGINHGPITAGVIGARKPHYDIWGNTVNVASRMESTGKAGCIQVTEDTCQILQNFGFKFEQRGLVSVKGKGQLMTYYLLGRVDVEPPPASPANTGQAMATLKEEDEASPTADKNAAQNTSSPVPQCGSVRSPNGTIRSTECNGAFSASPSKSKSAGDQVEEDAKTKLLQDDHCVDSSVDARESDALLKH